MPTYKVIWVQQRVDTKAKAGLVELDYVSQVINLYAAQGWQAISVVPNHALHGVPVFIVTLVIG